MTTLSGTSRYIFILVGLILILQGPVATGQSKMKGVTVSYEQSGTSRIARFTNSNPYPVRVEFSYQGTRTRGSTEASGEGAVLNSSRIFRHVWGRWPFHQVGPNQSRYAGGLRPPKQFTSYCGTSSAKLRSALPLGSQSEFQILHAKTGDGSRAALTVSFELRNQFTKKWNYIRENPVRAGLVAQWKHWPHQRGFSADE